MTNKRSIAQLQAKTLPILLELVIHVGIGSAAPLHAATASSQVAAIGSHASGPSSTQTSMSSSSSRTALSTTGSATKKASHPLRRWHSHDRRSAPQPIPFSGRLDELSKLDALQRAATLQGLQNYILHNARHVVRDTPAAFAGLGGGHLPTKVVVSVYADADKVEAERLERVRRVVEKRSEDGFAKAQQSVSPQLAVLRRKLSEKATDAGSKSPRAR